MGRTGIRQARVHQPGHSHTSNQGPHSLPLFQGMLPGKGRTLCPALVWAVMSTSIWIVSVDTLCIHQ